MTTRGSGTRDLDGHKRPTSPELDWALATRFRHLRDGAWVPLLVTFSLPPPRDDEAHLSAMERFSSLGWLGDQFRSERTVRIPEFMRRLARSEPPSPLDFYVLYVRKQSLDDVSKDLGWLATIDYATLGPPISLPETGIPDFPSPSPTPAPPPPTVPPMPRVAMGVIDQGIAFAHERFRNASGSRIAYLWRQDLLPPAGPINSFGSELTAAKINAEIDLSTSRGEQEDAIYRRVGGLDFASRNFQPLSRRRSHGTHVLDLAAGEPLSANAENRPIIAVEMPEEAVGDPVGSTLTIHALHGILYILERAEDLRAKQSWNTLPVVINLSYGPHDGPHDGSSWFERAVDWLQKVFEPTKTPVRFVFAAGNFRQSRIHAHAIADPGCTVELRVRVQPDDKTPSFIELWLAGDAITGDNVTIELTPPIGPSVFVRPDAPDGMEPPGAGYRYRLTFAEAGVVGKRAYALANLGPTVSELPFDPAAPVTVPSGVWTLSVTSKQDSSPVEFDAWIRRDASLAGRRSRGRQSYFEDKAYEDELARGKRPAEFEKENSSPMVKRRSTLSGIASGAAPYVIAGYRRGDFESEMHPAPYSSGGPTENPDRTMSAPTLSFPSDRSVACHGVLAAGTLSGSIVAMNGSSVAAPQAARWIALYRAAWGHFPKPPFAGGLPPGRNPTNPIPAGDVKWVVGDGLMRVPLRRRER